MRDRRNAIRCLLADRISRFGVFLADGAPGDRRSQGGDCGGVVGRQSDRALELDEVRQIEVRQIEARWDEGHPSEDRLREDHRFLGLRNEVHRREVR